MRPIQVGVVDEHEIFRRGVVSCLAEDPSLLVLVDSASGPLPEDVHVAVVSNLALSRERFCCPVVLCTGEDRGGVQVPGPHRVLAILPRSTLTSDQLIGAVRAAAAGLMVNEQSPERHAPQRLDHRRLQVLRLLADGADTLDISRSLRYSERTIKSLIQEIERELGARSRAQAVAEGIRKGLI